MEVMMVVTIIGLLSAIATVGYRHCRLRAIASSFGNDLRVYKDAVNQYVGETGNYNIGAPSGQLPIALNAYVKNTAFERKTVIGGHWRIDSSIDSIELAVGVEHFNAPIETLDLIDRLFDNGNIDTGSLRLVSANKYFWIIKE